MSRGPLAQRPHAIARSLVVIVLVLFACTLAAVGSSNAQAQEGSREVPGYRAIIEEALAEYAAQNYLEAMTLFARAHELWPNSRTLRGLGVVAFELHRYSDSVTYLEQALAASEKRLDDNMRADAERLLARARGFVATITITAEPPDAQLMLDGEPTPRRANGKLLLDIGKHHIELRAHGYETERLSHTVLGGEALNWTISLRKKETSSAPLVADTRRPLPLRRWHKVLGGGAVGLGVVSLVSAGVFTARRGAEGDRYRAVAPIDAEYLNALHAWEDTRAKPYAFAATGAIALASGATTLLLRAANWRLAVVGAGVSAATGTALAAWGTAGVLRGGPCGTPPAKRQACSEELERRDRGAVVLLSSFALVAAPLALLLREWLGQRRVSTVALWPGFGPLPGSLLFNVRSSWL